MSLPYWKYRPYQTQASPLPDRQWPNQIIEAHPIWCSTDLRDGNQALVRPMDTLRKRRLFDLLCRIGVKEIEVGFPSASRADFEFVRSVIEEGAIPDDVTIAVLTQAREELITRTFEAISGAARAIVHLYNSTSVAQRRVVFRMNQEEVLALALRGVTLCRELAGNADGVIRFEYTPESFDSTEDQFALEICEAVTDTWNPKTDEMVIINLPTTVERFMPHVYADRIEWFRRHFSYADRTILSVHPHNDRGTAVATAEMGLLAGAERVEGTLFGNGERTGNVDLVTLALNLHTQGVDCGLELGDIDGVREVVEWCNQMPVPARHPYAGELVYTAFSGSHQDAMSKGMFDRERARAEHWDVPYLPVDPVDLGRSYEAIIRVNSQSGKGGVGHTMATAHHFELPRELLITFARKVQALTDETGDEVSPPEMLTLFEKNYLDPGSPLVLDGFEHAVAERDVVTAQLDYEGEKQTIRGEGDGPIEALVVALNGLLGGGAVAVMNYSEHAMSRSASARAAAYVEADVRGIPIWGAATERSTLRAAIGAVIAAVNHGLCAASPRFVTTNGTSADVLRASSDKIAG